MRLQATGMALLIVFALVACDEHARAEAPTARTLAERLERAGVCTDARPTPAEVEKQLRVTGMTDTWYCKAPRADTSAKGGVQVGLWAGRTPAQKRRVLERMDDLLQGFCSSEDSAKRDSGASGPILPEPAGAPERTRVTELYVEGETWLALVGINARFNDIAATLNGRAVTKRCTTR